MRAHLALLAAGAALSTACRDTTAPPSVPERVLPLYYLKAPTNSGDGQTDTVLATLPLPFRVLVRRGDSPAPGILVLWQVPGDTLYGTDPVSAFAVTDDSGIAVSPFRLTLGRWTGTYAARASIQGVVQPGPIFIGTDAPCGSGLCFTATAIPGKPTHLRYVSGNGQTDATNATLSAAYVVRVLDSHDNAVVGVGIDWAVTAGGGSITPARNVTAAPDGYAAARHTLGPTEGPQSATATAAGMPGTPQVTFTAMAFAPGAVATVTVTPQAASVVVGGTVQLSAVLRDVHGLVLNGRSITWSSTRPDVATVDANGLVAGAASGTAAVVATSEGVSDTAAITVVAVPSGFLTTLATGSGHTCGLTSDGTPYCWGANGGGALGNGSTTNSPIPVAVAGGLRFRALAPGGIHTCALTETGAVYCWGGNIYGQVGDGTLADRLTPVAVSGGPSVSTLASMGVSFHACALTGEGLAYCWGLNDFGQLGIGTSTGPTVCHTDPEFPEAFYTCSTIPLTVAGGLTFNAIAAGEEFSCGLTSSGAAYCWGYNKWGQLGIGTASPETCTWGALDYPCSTIPAVVSGGLTFSALTLGDSHACGLTSAGAAYCWGFNADGELGDGTGELRSFVPAAVAGGLRFRALAAGGRHTCGLTDTGAAYCWGANTYGQLGNGTTTSAETPVAVTEGLSFSTLAAGGAHTCGITSSGAALCWGANSSGQLGNGSFMDSSIPVPVARP